VHRLIVDASVLAAERPQLPKSAAHHLKVLRPEPGEQVELFDGRGAFRTYSYDGALVAVSAVGMEARPKSELTLFACVTKSSRWDWTIEKATELGVTRIVPVISERTIVRIRPDERESKRERWMRVAEAAAVQSGSRWVPQIVPAVDFGRALELASKTVCFTGALTEPPSPGILAAMGERGLLAGGGGAKIAAFIGPEGDFTPEELDRLMRVSVPVSFGPKVLRAETAAVFALSVLSCAM
jgi:16S rRNA (uracil1498-N3)-methyltransferase